MNPGLRLSRFIADYTGISNAMLADATDNAEVMHRFADFIQGYNLVAHNAAFDKRFLDAELSRIGRCYDGQFSCSLLLARRIYQDAPSHKLASLVSYANIVTEGDFHRALFDSQMTAQLWLAMLAELTRRYGLNTIPFSLLQKLAKTPKNAVHQLLSQQA